MYLVSHPRCPVLFSGVLLYCVSVKDERGVGRTFVGGTVEERWVRGGVGWDLWGFGGAGGRCWGDEARA